MLMVIGSTGGLGSGLVNLAKELSREGKLNFGEIVATTRENLDLTQEKSVLQFVESIQKQAKAGESIKVINATGISINGMLHKSDLQDFEKTIQVNVTGNYLLLKHLQPLFKAHPGSSAVILSSVVGELGVAGTGAYASSKAALRGLCRVSAKEFARLQATVNVLELGYFETGMIRQVPESAQEALKNEIPLNRFGKVSELFEACRFALSCGYLTGTHIKLNGGMI